MNSLTRVAKIKYFPLVVRSYSSDLVGVSGWYPDIKPGSYPKTEKERKEAAKKYGLLKEEYEPYPDDGNGFGDYPKIKMESMDAKSEYYSWHDTYSKRLYGETLHVYHPVLSYERFSTKRKRFSLLYQLFCLLAALSVVAVPCWFLSDLKQHHRVLEKQYPNSETVHYTFELNNEDSDQLESSY